MTSTKPKPCPFCGEVPDADHDQSYWLDHSFKWGAIACGCGAQGPDVRTGYKPIEEWRNKAIEEWNKRA